MYKLYLVSLVLCVLYKTSAKLSNNIPLKPWFFRLWCSNIFGVSSCYFLSGLLRDALGLCHLDRCGLSHAVGCLCHKYFVCVRSSAILQIINQKTFANIKPFFCRVTMRGGYSILSIHPIRESSSVNSYQKAKAF